jgi:hypothetical protein
MKYIKLFENYDDDQRPEYFSDTNLIGTNGVKPVKSIIPIDWNKKSNTSIYRSMVKDKACSDEEIINFIENNNDIEHERPNGIALSLAENGRKGILQYLFDNNKLFTGRVTKEFLTRWVSHTTRLNRAEIADVIYFIKNL